MEGIDNGTYRLYPIQWGTFLLDGGAMFGVVPKTMWNRLIPADADNRIPMTLRSLLLVGSGRKIVIEAGGGRKLSRKLQQIYGLDFSGETVTSTFTRLGITPDDITDVFLTHLHFDHASEATQRLTSGELTPTFPRARYYVQRRHYEHALSPTERDRASFFPDDFVPLHEAGRLELVDGPVQDILPGLDLLVGSGHTPYQQAILIRGGATYLFTGDNFPTSAHIGLPFIMSYDLQPLAMLEDKRRILQRAVEEGWIFVFPHDPQWSAGTVISTEKGFTLREGFNL